MKGYQFVNWFPRWRGIGFWRDTRSWAYIYDWRAWFLWWEVRKWSTRKPPAAAAPGAGEEMDAPQPVPGGAPVYYDAGLDDAAYLEMLAEQRHEANYRSAHGLPPADAALGAGEEGA